jgi:drug/metabolite transporter (DMT)-like permease
VTTESRQPVPPETGTVEAVAVEVKTRRAALLPLAAVAATVLLWASAFVAIRHVGADLSPGALSLGRLVVGSAVLGVFVLARRGGGGGWPVGRGWWRIAAYGLLWFGLYTVALNAAEQRLDAGTAAMLVNVGPILIAVAAGLLLREGFPRPLLAGCVVALAGVVLIGLATSTGLGDGWGVALCLVAAVGYAGGVVAQKPLLAQVSALRVTWLGCTLAAVACLPFAPQLVRELAAAPAATAGWLLYLGALPTALAFTTWSYALARTDAGRLGATTYLVPPVAIGLGWLLLGETPAPLALAGGAVCLAGVAVTRHRRR